MTLSYQSGSAPTVVTMVGPTISLVYICIWSRKYPIFDNMLIVLRVGYCAALACSERPDRRKENEKTDMLMQF